jgi:cytochrome b561
MFSVFPPFYYGLHSAFLGWVTLLLLFLMHVFAVVQRCDRQRSVWSYFYYFYHFATGVWIVTSLCFGYAWAEGQPVPADSQEW